MAVSVYKATTLLNLSINWNSIPQPVLLRIYSSITAEVVAEKGRAGEVVFEGKVGKRDVGLQQVEAYLHNCIDVDGLLWRMSIVALHYVGQVTGRDAEFVSVEVDTAWGAVVLCQQLTEAEEQLICMVFEYIYLYSTFT